MGIARTNGDLIQSMDVLHGKACEAQRDLFALIVEADLNGAWEDAGARDLAHWLSMRYGMSYWKASRWIEAAHGLVGLPHLSEAFASGELSVDKVVELARFAAPETEGHLIAWAKGVSVGASGTRGIWSGVDGSRRPGRRNGSGSCGGGGPTMEESLVWRGNFPRPMARWWQRPLIGWPRRSP